MTTEQERYQAVRGFNQPCLPADENDRCHVVDDAVNQVVNTLDRLRELPQGGAGMINKTP